MSAKLFSINDPVHGLMQFRNSEAALVKKIVSTNEFQRLRYIKQLGMAFFVYPGANHTRFSHSLGAAYLAKRLIEKISADSSEDGEEIKSGKELAIVSGLLHDIGHGPYSHMFEKVKYGDLTFNHEEMTGLIVDRISHANNMTEYCDLLKEVLRIIRFEDKDNNGGKLQIVNSLISSQLDVDRMDYLLRDSHFCGVDYGNYDKKWLMHGIECCKKGGRYIIGINRKAIGVIEHYLMARRLMTNCVYRHPKIVASEHMLASFIESLYEDENLNDFIKNDLYNRLPLINYLKKIKEKNSFSNALDEYLKISDVDVEMLIKLIAVNDANSDKDFKMIANRIFSRVFPRIYEIDYSRGDEASFIIDMFKKDSPDIRKWQISFNLREFKTYKDNSKKIYVIDNYKKIKSIDHLSIPVFSMTNKNEVNPILIIDNAVDNQPSVNKLKKKLLEECCFVNCSAL